jgi:hypothetical protein
MLQKFLTAVVAEEWARQYEASAYGNLCLTS